MKFTTQPSRGDRDQYISEVMRRECLRQVMVGRLRIDRRGEAEGVRERACKRERLGDSLDQFAGFNSGHDDEDEGGAHCSGSRRG